MMHDGTLEGIHSLSTDEKAAPNGWDNLATLLFHRWGELDPGEAMRRVRQLGEMEAHFFGSAILVAWMRNDPEAAYRWSLGNRKFAESIQFDRMKPHAGWIPSVRNLEILYWKD